MIGPAKPTLFIPPGISLRTELSLRGAHHAAAFGHLHERTDGHVPSIIFGLDEHGRHGNFHPSSYAAICANTEWSRRLEKIHTASKRMKPRSDWQWKELDCSNSSDALLMNIFCHPEASREARFRSLFDVGPDARIQFGFKPRTPLLNGGSDNTEVDLRLGELLVEAKLTESGFQCASADLILRYRDLEEFFDVSELPLRNGGHVGYQLIRGALAAYSLGTSFCVLCDARRPDLIELWYKVMRATQTAELRCRLKLLTWQELASTLPADLQNFLASKYGIERTGGDAGSGFSVSLVTKCPTAPVASSPSSSASR